jgi:hypothetical protein
MILSAISLHKKSDIGSPKINIRKAHPPPNQLEIWKTDHMKPMKMAIEPIT